MIPNCTFACLPNPIVVGVTKPSIGFWKGPAFEELEVLSNPAAMEELKDLTGKTMTPTIEVNGDILADFEWMSWSLGGRNTALIAECNLFLHSSFRTTRRRTSPAP